MSTILDSAAIGQGACTGQDLVVLARYLPVL